jgi:hypothetical protein
MGTVPLTPRATYLPHVWGDVYIETGLSEGTSMAVALAFSAPRFAKLYGIEVDDEMFTKSCDRFRQQMAQNRLSIYEGSSLDVLPQILSPDKKTVFWLDAHYDGAKPTSFDPRHGQCVLLEELRLILAVPWKSRPFILIDDASTFCSDVWWDRGAHGVGMDRKQNPTFQQIYDVVGAVDNKYDLFIKEQCIYCFPRD